MKISNKMGLDYPIYPSDVFYWNTKTKRAVSTVDMVMDANKNPHKKIKVFSLDGFIFIKSTETGETTKWKYTGEFSKNRHFKCIQGPDKMLSWELLVCNDDDDIVKEIDEEVEDYDSGDMGLLD